jgi:hypothetical protein
MSPIIYSSASQILYEIPSGKPDPLAPCSEETARSRPRVIQMAQKGATCWYYALNLIRNRIGKNPSESLQKDREFERIVSQKRKLVTSIRQKHTNDQNIVRQLMTDPKYRSRQLWTKRGASQYLPQIEQLLTSPKLVTKEEATKLYRILKGFIEQSRFDHLQDYVNASQCDQFNQINQMFLSRLGKNPEAYFEIDKAANAKIGIVDRRRWSDLSAEDKKPLLDNYFFRAAFEGYRLQVSAWQPEDGPERLVAVLREKGPMYTTGRLGQLFYADEPIVVNMIATRALLGWTQEDERNALSILHSVVIVGATSEGQGSVYFVDPSDESRPDRERPIYTSSYDDFIVNIADLKNGMANIEERRIYSREFGYGLHAPQ